MKLSLPLSALLAALLFAACGSSDDAGLSSPAQCVPNKVEACACPGSTVQGAQSCTASGTFGPCLGCPGQGGSGGTSPGGNGGNGGSTGAGNAGGSNQGGSSQGGSTNGGAAGQSGPSADSDKDGWTPAQGDCNDFDPSINPGAVELLEVGPDGKPLAQQRDNDCDGKTASDAASLSCDQGLALTDVDPFNAARAMGLCRVKVDEASKQWGVIAASYNRIAGGFLGSPLAVKTNVGLVDGFGPSTTPREGQRMFALSTGEARAAGQQGFTSNTCGQSGNQVDSFPPGFPKQGSCGQTGKPFDGVALDLKIRVPTNARSVRFKYRFFSCEFPVYVCQQYNDVFAVLLNPSPLPAGDPMTDAQNLTADIAFEKDKATGKKEVIGVNNQSFLTACQTGKSGYVNCKGEGELAGTGFEGHAGSSWLVNQANVPPGGIISMRIAVWDSGDGALDTTALLDAFEWSTDSIVGAINYTEGTTPDPGDFAGAGGTNGSGGSGQGGGDLFGGSGGSELFGGGGANGGNTSTAGTSSGGNGTAGSGGNGMGSNGGNSAPCPNGTCAADGQCCLDPAKSTCGTLFGGMCL